MQKKIGEIFKSDKYGKTYRVVKSNLRYPSKCKDCDFCTAIRKGGIATTDCKGILNETGDCRPYRGEKKSLELIFKEVKEENLIK